MMMLGSQRDAFLQGFSDYCKFCVDRGKCAAIDSCAFCVINEAYNVILEDFLRENEHCVTDSVNED